jgi:hypothetical protein
MKRRGHVAYLVLMVMAAVVAGAGGFATRALAASWVHRRDAVRLQALWLLRSAEAAGLKKDERIATPFGTAAVHVERKGKASRYFVDLQGDRAETDDAGAERYQAAP